MPRIAALLVIAALTTIARAAAADAAGTVVRPSAAGATLVRAASPWRWPVRGEVVTPFRVAPNPFAAGQHRGIDIAAPAGARVRSACAGRVRFAGRLPGRGRVVTVVCGTLVATYLELGSVAVRRGAAVVAGSPIGTVAASHLQLGARRTGVRAGYVDPLAVLRADGVPPPGLLPPARSPRVGSPRAGPPRGVAGPGGSPVAAPRPAPVSSPRGSPAGGAASPAGRVPLVAWAGLALVVAGMPVGAVVRGRARRRRAARIGEPGGVGVSR